MKKKSSLVLLAITTTILSLSSCYPYPIDEPYAVPESRQKENLYYVPSAANTQLLSEKNDLGFNLVRSGASKLSGVEAQASYLPGRHFGIAGGYSSIGNGNSDYSKYRALEGSIGFITQLSKEWHFETYAGAGTGKIDNIHYTGTSKVNLTRFFLQPGIAVSNEKKTVQFGFVSKFSGVHFKVDTAYDNARESFSTNQLMGLYNKPFHLMWEPGFVFRVGWKNFLFHTSYLHSADLTAPSLHRATDNFSIGGSLRVNTSTKKIKN